MYRWACTGTARFAELGKFNIQGSASTVPYISRKIRSLVTFRPHGNIKRMSRLWMLAETKKMPSSLRKVWRSTCRRSLNSIVLQIGTWIVDWWISEQPNPKKVYWVNRLGTRATRHLFYYNVLFRMPEVITVKTCVSTSMGSAEWLGYCHFWRPAVLIFLG